MKPWLTLVGIGEDGYPGLGKAARRALLAATRIVGAPRQLALLPPCITGERETWPSPFDLQPLLARRGEAVCVLASGDPMFYGVGASLARQVPVDRLLVETDSPYLAPVPHRGKPNLPQYVREVAEYLAVLRGVSYEALAEQTSNNFKRLFPLAGVA